MKWHGSHNGRNTVRLSLSFEGIFPPKAHYRTAYSEKSKRGAGSALHRAGGGSSDRKEEKFPLYPFLIADLSACYDFDYWKIVEICKNRPFERM